MCPFTNTPLSWWRRADNSSNVPEVRGGKVFYLNNMSCDTWTNNNKKGGFKKTPGLISLALLHSWQEDIMFPHTYLQILMTGVSKMCVCVCVPAD